MTERLGDQRMQLLLRGHNDIVRHEVAAYGGFEVKSLGDGFILAFSSTRRAQPSPGISMMIRQILVHSKSETQRHHHLQSVFQVSINSP